MSTVVSRVGPRCVYAVAVFSSHKNVFSSFSGSVSPVNCRRTVRCLGMRISQPVDGKPVRVDQEHPRHERAAMGPSVKSRAKNFGDKVRAQVARSHEGKREKYNEPRKAGMYLAKELCDLKLKEIAEHFGTASDGTVGWACHGVASRMQADVKFLDCISSIRRNLPTKDLTPF